MIKFKNKE